MGLHTGEPMSAAAGLRGHRRPSRRAHLRRRPWRAGPRVGGRARADRRRAARRRGLPRPRRASAQGPCRPDAAVPGSRPGLAARLSAGSIARHAPEQPAAPALQLHRPQAGDRRCRGPPRHDLDAHPDRAGRSRKDAARAGGRGAHGGRLPRWRVVRRAGHRRRRSPDRRHDRIGRETEAGERRRHPGA